MVNSPCHAQSLAIKLLLESDNTNVGVDVRVRRLCCQSNVLLSEAETLLFCWICHEDLSPWNVVTYLRPDKDAVAGMSGTCHCDSQAGLWEEDRNDQHRAESTASSQLCCSWVHLLGTGGWRRRMTYLHRAAHPGQAWQASWLRAQRGAS